MLFPSLIQIDHDEEARVFKAWRMRVALKPRRSAGQSSPTVCVSPNMEEYY